MSDTMPPNAPDPPTGPAVGQDEWVARHGEHRVTRGGRLGPVQLTRFHSHLCQVA